MKCTRCKAEFEPDPFAGGATIIWYGGQRDDDEICPKCGESLRRWRDREEPTADDPVATLIALDRNAARKADYIERHGAEKFIELVDATREQGYRGCP